MDQALLQLAFAMHRNPGLYALLIGSGVSRAAEIPTGWMVILDLIRQIMETMGEEADDPIEWYRSTFDEEPTYSAILERLAPKQPERNGLLRPYFEPTDEEREEGIKLPTDAHKSIAWLVKRGYVKIILTTNFDRLLEIAIEAEGITPDVYSSDDDFASMAPIQHSDVVIVKLHGDYRDWRIKNSADELAEYSQPLQNLLRRIFQEYGLIIGGWSGEYDTALRKALLQPTNSRMPNYGLYWLAYKGNTTTVAQSLVDQRNAQTVSIQSADKFFTALRDSIEALENASKDKSLSISVLVERVKRYLRSDEYTIDLEELLRQEVSLATKEFNSEEFNNQQSRLKTFQERWHSYLEPLRRVLNILTIIGWYGQKSHEILVKNTVEQLLPHAKNPYIHRFVPALLAMYTVGIPATYCEKWYFLKAALENARSLNPNIGRFSSGLICCFEALVFETHRSINSGAGYSKSLVEETFRPELEQLFKEFITNQNQFEQIFDLFEMMQCLIYLEQSLRHDWMPVHQTIYGRSVEFLVDYWQNAPRNWEFTNVIFKGDGQQLMSTLTIYDEIRKVYTRRYPFNVYPYPRCYEQSPDAISRGVIYEEE